MKTEKATFGAGCFWHVEEAFSRVKGAVKTTAGYMGGTLKNPTYEDVCTDKTGHAEAVQIEYDPSVVSYKELLGVFWKIHGPTSFNKQGADAGTQYRSVVFYHDEEQKSLALKSMKEEQKKHDKKIATEIKKAATFYKAEEYHQKYFQKNKIFKCGG